MMMPVFSCIFLVNLVPYLTGLVAISIHYLNSIIIMAFIFRVKVNCSSATQLRCLRCQFPGTRRWRENKDHPLKLTVKCREVEVPVHCYYY